MMSILMLLFIVVGLIGLGMLAVGAFIMLQGSQETRRLVGIILLILGLLLACTPVLAFVILRFLY